MDLVTPEVEPGSTDAAAAAVAPEVSPGATKSFTAPPTDAPWGIKKIATRTREKALLAARQDGKSVGEWLTEVIDAHIEQKREPITGYDVLVPGTDINPSRDGLPALTVQELHAALILGEELRQKMGWRRYPTGLGRAIHRALMARLEGLE
jgi:hypothetical protein